MPAPHRRPLRPLRTAVWLTAAVAAVAIVKGTRVGPVVLVVSERHGWGVHTGDALALIPLTLAALTHLALGHAAGDEPPSSAR